jgi:hypothetical protein
MATVEELADPWRRLACSVGLVHDAFDLLVAKDRWCQGRTMHGRRL